MLGVFGQSRLWALLRLPPLRATGSVASVGLIHSFAAAQGSHVLEQQVLRGHRFQAQEALQAALAGSSAPWALCWQAAGWLGHLTAACYCCHAHPGVSFHTKPLSPVCFTFLMSWELCWGTEHPPLNETLSFLQRRKGDSCVPISNGHVFSPYLFLTGR